MRNTTTVLLGGTSHKSSMHGSNHRNSHIWLPADGNKWFTCSISLLMLCFQICYICVPGDAHTRETCQAHLVLSCFDPAAMLNEPNKRHYAKGDLCCVCVLHLTCWIVLYLKPVWLFRLLNVFKGTYSRFIDQWMCYFLDPRIQKPPATNCSWKYTSISKLPSRNLRGKTNYHLKKAF